MKNFNKLFRGICILFIFSIGCSGGCGGCLDSELEKKVKSPSFEISIGSYYDITLSSATKDAKIKYTVDGTDPKTSESSVEGNTVTIDVFTTIKAYAYKEELLDSDVSEFKISLSPQTRVIQYSSSFMIQNYYNYALDCNGSKIFEIWYKNPGNDLKWFTEDDSIDFCYLYQYTDGQLSKKTKLTNPGADNEWLTKDDTADSYFTVTSAGNKISRMDSYTSAGVLDCSYTYDYNTTTGLLDKETKLNADSSAAYYFTYTYNENGIAAKVKYDGSNQLISTSAFNYQNNNAFSDAYSYSNNLATQKNRYSNYGADTLDYTTSLEYNSDNNVIKEIKHIFSASSEVENNSVYSYDENKLLTKSQTYTGSAAENLLSFINYQYDDNSLLIKEQKYSGVETDNLEEYSNYEYDVTTSRLARKITYVNPGPETKEVKWNITIAAGVENGGFYASGGVTYDTGGVYLSDYINPDLDDSDFIKEIINKVKGIADNTALNKSGLTINGSEGGSCVIKVTANASHSTGKITVSIIFDAFDDGDDIVLNGEIVKTLEGNINIDGSVSGSLNGTFTGSIRITSENPSWKASDFVLSYYSQYDYDSNGNIIKETVNSDAGADGNWFTADDSSEYYIDYLYANGLLDKKIKKMNYGILETNTLTNSSVSYYTFEYGIGE